MLYESVTNQNPRIDDYISFVQNSSEIGDLSGDTMRLDTPSDEHVDNNRLDQTPTNLEITKWRMEKW